jgi:plasmid stabilization system protein ParE
MVQKIIWTKEAQHNLAEIKDYISIDSEYYALKVITLLYLSVQKLVKFPEAGMEVYQSGKHKVRRVLIKRYRILYIIKAEAIFIIAVYHQSKQSPSSHDFSELF